MLRICAVRVCGIRANPLFLLYEPPKNKTVTNGDGVSSCSKPRIYGVKDIAVAAKASSVKRRRMHAKSKSTCVIIVTRVNADGLSH